VRVRWFPAAAQEFGRFPEREQDALDRAVKKLEEYGEHLSFPHSSAIQGAHGWRELRPRAGRSRWRAVYRQHDDAMLIAAVGPEARVDPSGFQRAVRTAATRYAALLDQRE